MAAGFNIADFRAIIDSNGGLVGNNRFLVSFVAPRALRGADGVAQTVSYMCKSSMLPGVGIRAEDIIRYGYGPIERKPYGTVVNDAMMMFYTDGSNSMRSFFRNWMRSIVNMDSRGQGKKFNGNDPYTFGYKTDYMVDLRVTAFDPEGNPTIQVVLFEAWPNFVGDVMMDWQDRNSNMILPISFTFKDWFEESVADPREEVSAPQLSEPAPEPEPRKLAFEDAPELTTSASTVPSIEPPKIDPEYADVKGEPIRFFNYDLGARIGIDRFPGTEAIDAETPRRVAQEAPKTSTSKTRTTIQSSPTPTRTVAQNTPNEAPKIFKAFDFKKVTPVDKT